MTSGKNLYVLIDGENINLTLIRRIRGRNLKPGEYPDWESVLAHLQALYEPRRFRSIYVLNAAAPKNYPTGTVRGFRRIGMRVIEAESAKRIRFENQLVDREIIKQLKMIKGTRDNVIVISNDGDYREVLDELHQTAPERMIRVMGFLEHMSGQYYHARHIAVDDLEFDTPAFSKSGPLPRDIQTLTR